jgi:hypothetical protein
MTNLNIVDGYTLGGQPLFSKGEKVYLSVKDWGDAEGFITRISIQEDYPHGYRYHVKTTHGVITVWDRTLLRYGNQPASNEVKQGDVPGSKPPAF